MLAQAPSSFGKLGGHGGGAAQSRSTSAGSSLSDSQKSFDQKAPPPTSDLECPSWYNHQPTPWSTIQEVLQMTDADCAPSFLADHSIGANDWQHLQGGNIGNSPFQMQSLPTSSIGLPPGLEHLIDPEEAATKLAAANFALRHTLQMAKVGGETQVVESLGNPNDVLFYDSNMASHLFTDAPPTQLSDVDYASIGFAQAWPRPELGSMQCPTVGSQDHYFGTCRPCAFLFTKGCANGVSCPFCHLCDFGERKRRAKVNRAQKKMAAKWSCNTTPQAPEQCL